MTEALPDERFWKTYTRHQEFPISATVAVVFHMIVIGMGLFGVFSFFFDKTKDTIEWDTVYIEEPPGAGNAGTDRELAKGSLTGQDVTDVIQAKPVKLGPDEISPVKPIVQIPSEQPILAESGGDTVATPQKPLEPIRPLSGLIKLGSPKGADDKGNGGPGKGVGGVGAGTIGNGTGSDLGGKMSQKQRRQLRWTILFNIRTTAEYVAQLRQVGAQVGLQMENSDVYMIRDLARRPALAEKSKAPGDRIFWMDDNPDSIRAMCDELGIRLAAWRMIAFFPESFEQQLLEKELLHGKSFGRMTEDDIRETKFRLEFRNGFPRISVVEQR